MIFTAGIKRKLQARHYLVGDFGDETLPHSHPYDVEMIGSVAQLDENGFSLNIALLEEVMEETLAGIDDKLLNSLPFFTGRQASLENLCLFLREEILKGISLRNSPLPGDLEIRIWESDSAWASCRGAVGVPGSTE